MESREGVCNMVVMVMCGKMKDEKEEGMVWGGAWDGCPRRGRLNWWKRCVWKVRTEGCEKRGEYKEGRILRKMRERVKKNVLNYFLYYSSFLVYSTCVSRIWSDVASIYLLQVCLGTCLSTNPNEREGQLGWLVAAVWAGDQTWCSVNEIKIYIARPTYWASTPVTDQRKAT